MAPRLEKNQKDACGGDGAVEKCPLKAKITVTVRVAYFNPGEGESFTPGTGIAGASFTIDGAARGPKTAVDGARTGLPPTVPRVPSLGPRASREVGTAQIPVGDLDDGEHVLEVLPPSGQDSTAPADSRMTSPGAGHHRFRPIRIRFKLKAGLITEAPVIDAPAPVNHAYVVAWNDKAIALDWKPDWFGNLFVHRARGAPVSLIVVHESDGTIISGALNQALQNDPNHGWHYLIDHDGHVSKFVQDDERTSNAAPAAWRGAHDINGIAVGIELVPYLGRFTDAQYAALLTLLFELLGGLGIEIHRIVGHSDVDLGNAAHGQDPLDVGVNRTDDPGPNFEWTRLEAVGLGIMPKPDVPRNQGWAEYFSKYPDPLRSGDRDGAPAEGRKPARPARWGGSERKGETLTGVVKGLQDDLTAIGYGFGVSEGSFEGHLTSAVKAFKRHFLTGTRGPYPGENSPTLGQVDADTAWLIQAVAAFVRNAEAQAAARRAAAPGGH